MNDTQVLLNPTVFPHLSAPDSTCHYDSLPRLITRSDLGLPTCDMFAGPGPQEHKAPLFFTLYACPGTLGVNVSNHAWKDRAPVANSTLLWIFPPIF